MYYSNTIILSGVLMLSMQLTGEELPLLQKKYMKKVNQSADINITCKDMSDRFEVVFAQYSLIDMSTSQGTVPRNTCNIIYKTGDELKNTPIFECSAFIGRCMVPNVFVNNGNEIKCENSMPVNFFLMEYKCVNADSIMDLCSKAQRREINSTTYLGYFPSVQDRLKNCSCQIQGLHELRTIIVGVPSPDMCQQVHLQIDWESEGKTNSTNVTSSKYLINEVISENITRSQIKMVRNCSRLTAPVWFKIIPAGGQKVTITCGYNQVQTTTVSSKTNTPSSKSTASTATTATTEESNIEDNITNTVSTQDVSTVHSSRDNTTSMNINPKTTDQDETPSRPGKSTTELLQPTNANARFSDAPPKVGIIVGSTLGGIVLLVIVVTIPCVLIRRRNQREKEFVNGAERNQFPPHFNYDEILDGGYDFPNNAFNSYEYPEPIHQPIVSETGDYDHLTGNSVLQSLNETNPTENVYNKPKVNNNPDYDHLKNLTTIKQDPVNLDDPQFSHYDMTDPVDSKAQDSAVVSPGPDQYSTVTPSSQRYNPEEERTDGQVTRANNAYHILEKSDFKIDDSAAKKPDLDNLYSQVNKNK